MIPTFAIIGRANVGKSTLFNKLTGKKYAITANIPGITRDIQTKQASLLDINFNLIDTAGFQQDKGDKEQKMRDFMLQALAHADALIVMLDGLTPLNKDDIDLLHKIRCTTKPYVILINKAENRKKSYDAQQELHASGFNDFILFSAAHNEGTLPLYEFLQPICDDFDKKDSKVIEKPVILSIIGRPNVGKSTLINSIFAETRVLAGDEAGLTRDSTRHRITKHGQLYELIDTAGLRRRAKIHDDIEKMSVQASFQALKYAHIALLMIDATQGIEKQDLVLAERIIDEGRAPIILLNKWDLITDKDDYLKNLNASINHIIPRAKFIDIVPISASDNYNLDAIFKVAHKVYNTWNTRISTAKLNQWLSEVTSYNPPNPAKGVRPKFSYITQHKARPPSFILFVTRKNLIQDSYIQFLENRLRKDFDLKAVPIRFILRAKKNPYSTSS